MIKKNRHQKGTMNSVNEGADVSTQKTAKPPQSKPEKEKEKDKRKTSSRREEAFQQSYQQRQHLHADNTITTKSGLSLQHKSGRQDEPKFSTRQEQTPISAHITTAPAKKKNDTNIPLSEPFSIDKSANIGGTSSSSTHKPTGDKKSFPKEKRPQQGDDALKRHRDESVEREVVSGKIAVSPSDFGLTNKAHKRSVSSSFVGEKSPNTRLQFKKLISGGFKRRNSVFYDKKESKKKLKFAEHGSSGLPVEEEKLLAEEQKKKEIAASAATSGHSLLVLSPPPDVNVGLVIKSAKEIEQSKNLQNGKQTSTVEVPKGNNCALSPPLELNVSENYESDGELGSKSDEDDFGDKSSERSINSNEEQGLDDSEPNQSPDEDVYLVGYFPSGMPNIRYSAHDPLHDKFTSRETPQNELPTTSPKPIAIDIADEDCDIQLPSNIQNKKDTLVAECEKSLNLTENNQEQTSIDSQSQVEPTSDCHSIAVEMSLKSETTDNVEMEPEVEAGESSTKVEVQSSNENSLSDVVCIPTETSEIEVQHVFDSDDLLEIDEGNSETLPLAESNDNSNNEPEGSPQQSEPNLMILDDEVAEDPALKSETDSKQSPTNETSNTSEILQQKEDEREENKTETSMSISPEPLSMESEISAPIVEPVRYQTPDEPSFETDSDSNSQLEPEMIANEACDIVEMGTVRKAAATMVPPIHIVGDLDEESEDEGDGGSFSAHASESVTATMAAVGDTFAAPPPANTHLTKGQGTKRRSSTSALQAVKTKQTQLSAKDDFFKKPFEYGWKRELVWRSNVDSTCKADVYFISKNGKKFRSRSDILPLLEGDLTIDHFCFIREPQDVGPQFELVRNAKSSNRNVVAAQLAISGTVGTSTGPTTGATQFGLGKRIIKPKAPKGASPPPQGWTAVRALRSNNAALGHKIFGVSASGAPSSGSRNRYKSTSLKSSDQDVKLTQSNSNIGNNKDIAQSSSLKVAKTSHKSDANSNVPSLGLSNAIPSPTISKHPTHTLAPTTPLTATSTSAMTTTVLPKSELTQEIVVIKGKKFISMAQPVVHTPRIDINKSVPTDMQRMQTSVQKLKVRPVASLTSTPDVAVSSVALGRPAMPAGSNFFVNLSMGYNSIVSVIRLLKLQDRARLASVCRLWHAATNDRRLWQSVRLRNTRVTDWNILTRALCSHETRHLDMRKMLQLSTGSSSNQHRNDEMWQSFMRHIGKVYTLETLELPRCAALVVDNVLRSNAENLRILNASTISDQQLSLAALADMKQLQELRLRAVDPCQLMGDLGGLAQLTQLTHLALMGICNLSDKSINVLSTLEQLLTLELGYCGRLNSQHFAAVLQDMKQLRRLRLETGITRESPTETTEFCVLALLEGVRLAAQLFQLELINFDVKPGFDTLLAECTQLRKLLFIPTYIAQSATTNQIIMRAVQKLPNSLIAFTWGFTIELLRVTALYSDSKTESKDESIPVLRPVPGDVHDRIGRDSDRVALSTDDQHVAILSLKQLEFIMQASLPKTKFSTVKMFYSATWKQQMVN